MVGKAIPITCYSGFPHGFQIPFPDSTAAKGQNTFARLALHQDLQRPVYDLALGAQAGQLAGLRQ
jgi:hypothetical protein